MGKFHMCNEQGKLAAEFLCEDGLIFEALTKQCVLPFKSNCLREGRSQLQAPQPIGNCPRQNGKWAVEDTCNQYIDCTHGVERLVTCQNHLVFDDETGTANTLILLTERAALLSSCAECSAPTPSGS